jgi:hypothetical protein
MVDARISYMSSSIDVGHGSIVTGLGRHLRSRIDLSLVFLRIRLMSLNDDAEFETMFAERTQQFG